MPSVRIWVKKQLSVKHLNFKQREMLKLGTVAVASVKNRVSAAVGPDDSPSKPLTKKYAIYKSTLHKGNRRNLTLTGKMLGNFSLRTVSENTAKASLTSRKERIKAWANTNLQPWMIFSRKNRESVGRAAGTILKEYVRGMVFERLLGGRQQ